MKQNDIQSQGEFINGSWLSGINAIDSARLGDQTKITTAAKNNPGRNVYFFLPLILVIIGAILLGIGNFSMANEMMQNMPKTP